MDEKDGKPSTLTLTVKNATFVLDIAPGKTPGVEMSAVVYKAVGDAWAAANLSDTASFITVRGEGTFGGVGGLPVPAVVCEAVGDAWAAANLTDNESFITVRGRGGGGGVGAGGWGRGRGEGGVSLLDCCCSC